MLELYFKYKIHLCILKTYFKHTYLKHCTALNTNSCRNNP